MPNYLSPDWVIYFFACVLVMLDIVQVFGVEFVQHVVSLVVSLLDWIEEEPIDRLLSLYGLGEMAGGLWRMIRWIVFRS